MKQMAVHSFRKNLKSAVDMLESEHVPLRVTRRNGENFVVLSEEDWNAEQETLYVLQNKSLMQQIAESLQTLENRQGKEVDISDL